MIFTIFFYHKQGQGFKVRAAPPLPKLKSSISPGIQTQGMGMFAFG